MLHVLALIVAAQPAPSATPLPAASPAPALQGGFFPGPVHASPTPVPEPTDVVYGPVMNGWKAGLSIDPTSAPVGADMTVRIVLTNVSAVHARVAEYKDSCGYVLTVADLQSRDTVESTCFVSGGPSRVVPIGTSSVATFNLRYVHARTDGFHHVIEHSGRYRITVTEIFTDSNGAVPVQSNAVTLTIGE